MPDPSSPWGILSIEAWQRLLASTVEQGDFDLETAAQDAGLSGAETIALAAWVVDVEASVEARHRAGEMAPSTVKFLESLLPDIDDPDQRAAAEREVAAAKARGRHR